MSSQSEQDAPDTHTSARSTGGGRGRADAGGSQVDPSSSKKPIPHRCSRCGHPCQNLVFLRVVLLQLSD